MAKKKKSGLGKGLDSLIPDFFNEDFDSNEAESLEDMLKTNSSEFETEKESPLIEETTIADDIPIVESKVEEKDDEPSDDEIPIVEVDAEDKVEEPNVGENSIVEVDAEDKVEEPNVGENSIVEDEIQEKTPIVQEEISQDLDDGTVIDETEIEEESDVEEEEFESIELTESVLKRVKEVNKIVEKNPRITLWSSQSAAVFRYLRKTQPEFSISKEASILIDEAVSKKYPEIWELFEENESED